jgi:hypothetical protein
LTTESKWQLAAIGKWQLAKPEARKSALSSQHSATSEPRNARIKGFDRSIRPDWDDLGWNGISTLES